MRRVLYAPVRSHTLQCICHPFLLHCCLWRRQKPTQHAARLPSTFIREGLREARDRRVVVAKGDVPLASGEAEQTCE